MQPPATDLHRTDDSVHPVWQGVLMNLEESLDRETFVVELGIAAVFAITLLLIMLVSR